MIEYQTNIYNIYFVQISDDNSSKYLQAIHFKTKSMLPLSCQNIIKWLNCPFLQMLSNSKASIWLQKAMIQIFVLPIALSPKPIL